MYFYSFIICVIVNAIVVQSTNGAANATSQDAVNPANGKQPENIGFGEGAEYNIEGPKSKIDVQSNVQINEVKVSSDAAQSKTHSRGVTNTGIAPPADDSHKPKNNSTTNSTKYVQQPNNNQTVTVMNTKQAAPKVETKPVNATALNNQTKGADSKPQIPLVTSSTTTTTTTTTTTPVPTTTTQLPKKPSITVSVEDVPGLVTKAAEAQSQLPAKLPVEEVQEDGPLPLQSSETITYSDQRSTHNYIMSIVGILVIVPLMVLVTNCAVKRARDYWSKRRYRRMDYLIEDMYN